MPNPLQLLRECHRILKPNGKLVLTTPNNESWGSKLFKKAWRGLEPPRHLNIFTYASLLKIAQKAGLSKTKAFTNIGAAHQIFLESKSIQCTGTHMMGGPQPRTVRLWARGMQLAEWALLKVTPYVGEEIILIGEK